jgi:hypothetical protein
MLIKTTRSIQIPTRLSALRNKIFYRWIFIIFYLILWYQVQMMQLERERERYLSINLMDWYHRFPVSWWDRQSNGVDLLARFHSRRRKQLTNHFFDWCIQTTKHTIVLVVYKYLSLLLFSCLYVLNDISRLHIIIFQWKYSPAGNKTNTNDLWDHRKNKKKRRRSRRRKREKKKIHTQTNKKKKKKEF